MEKQVKILIADDNKDSKDRLVSYLSGDKNNMLLQASNGDELILKAKSENPDVIIMDLILPGKDGFSVIEDINAAGINSKIIITSSLSSDTFIQKAMSMGVYYYMLKPCDIISIEKRIKEIVEPAASIKCSETEFKNPIFENVENHNILMPVSNKNKYIEEKITNIFITVGIPAHIKGYQFLREAILMAIDNPEVINSITKQLYPTIASKFETTSSKVERAIRHAIEVAWNRGKIENINTVFGVKVYSAQEKPTNGEFIALVADKMILEG